MQLLPFASLVVAAASGIKFSLLPSSPNDERSSSPSPFWHIKLTSRFSREGLPWSLLVEMGYSGWIEPALEDARRVHDIKTGTWHTLFALIGQFSPPLLQLDSTDDVYLGFTCYVMLHSSILWGLKV